MSTLQNEILKINTKNMGAELTSIWSIKNNLEYLWQADPLVWPRHAPVLFPIVGALENGQYDFEGNTYKMGQHGFARDMNFEVLEHTETFITYQLKSSDETLKQYPFQFKFNITYTLSANHLTTTYEVLNTDTKEIYFSIGAHPGFQCPFTKEEKFEDCYIEFDQSESAEKHLLEGGILSGLTRPVLNDQKTIDINTNLFIQDALVFKKLKSEVVSLKSKTSSHYIKMAFKGFPFFGIWAKPGTNKFVCLEPWNGIASTKGSSSDLTKKEGVLRLATGKSFSCEFKLSFG
jgi:galactose mutarotase-like enzyme